MRTIWYYLREEIVGAMPGILGALLVLAFLFPILPRS